MVDAVWVRCVYGKTHVVAPWGGHSHQTSVIMKVVRSGSMELSM